jgi:hypothetical protein
MSKIAKDIIERGEARIVDAPVARPDARVDRSFNLPRELYVATAGAYLAFITIMFVGLATPGLIIPMAIFAVFIVAGFGVPTVWTRLKGNDSKPMTMGEFQQAGIMTHTGKLRPRDAVIQVLILPVLIVLWGLAAVTIAALV